MDGIEEKSTIDIKQWLLVALVVIVGLLVIGGGVFVYQKAMSKKKTTAGKVVITPTPELTEEISSSPTPEISPALLAEKKDLKIKILNGSGIPGLAGKAATYLENLGYSGIKTGNASSYDYEQTEIQIKESQKGLLEQLTKDLSQEYTLAEEQKTLAEDESFDVIITLGKK